MNASRVRTLPAPRGFDPRNWTGRLRQDQPQKPYLGKFRADVKPRSSN